MLFIMTRQYTHFSSRHLNFFVRLPLLSININNFHICFCHFDLSCSKLEFFYNLTFFIMYCLILLNNILFSEKVLAQI